MAMLSHILVQLLTLDVAFGHSPVNITTNTTEMHSEDLENSSSQHLYSLMLLALFSLLGIPIYIKKKQKKCVLPTLSQRVT